MLEDYRVLFMHASPNFEGKELYSQNHRSSSYTIAKPQSSPHKGLPSLRKILVPIILLEMNRIGCVIY